MRKRARPRESVRTRVRPTRTIAPRTARPPARTVTSSRTRGPRFTARGDAVTLSRVFAPRAAGAAQLEVVLVPGLTVTVTFDTPPQAATRRSSAPGLDVTSPPWTATA